MAATVWRKRSGAARGSARSDDGAEALDAFADAIRGHGREGHAFANLGGTGGTGGTGTTPKTGSFAKLGAYRPSDGSYSLDSNGNRTYDQGVDTVYRNFAPPGAIPVAGNWGDSADGYDKVGYFKELMETNPDISCELKPLLAICRETIVRIGKTESALIRSLRRDPLLHARVERLMTIPAVGPITALTWVLEVDDVARFHSVKQAVSYCGLCGAERSSAETIKRMPISKQRNKHLQSVLIEAAKLAPR